MKSIFILLMAIPVLTNAQVLTEKSKYRDHLKNGAEIILYSSRDCASCFYYLPVNLAVSQKSDGTPEVSLVTWKNDENSKVIGGILHFLVHWGLSQEEENYVASRLSLNMDSTAVLMGPATVQASAPGLLFQGKDDLAAVLTSHLTYVPTVPTTPGAKMAFSFNFGEDEIDNLMKHVNNSGKTDTKLVVSYTYTLLTAGGMQITTPLEMTLNIKEVLKLIK